ncbi:MAG: helix-turn-helix domain-containing protein [Candidatus Electryonea clarkiae]|nr:helix-turn-helix domain-containing protein [Candidatus Electryonea clarkiae]
MFKNGKDDRANKYLRERIKQARLQANETQEDLARRLQKTRVAVSDLERGRVSVSAAALLIIAVHYDKPVSYFYPDSVKVTQGNLDPLDEELIKLFWQLPDTQKHIALEYVRQQVEIISKALGHEASKKHAELKSKSN